MVAAMGIETFLDLQPNQVFRRAKNEKVVTLEEVYY
tara:strand:- start:897 stop:1004 length:108 start_codon:yes stop_codon:yes gene_type:complete